MKRYIMLAMIASTLIACVDINISNTHNINNGDSNEPLIESVGPDHDADVQLADADVWIVPPLGVNGSDVNEQVVWTLVHPTGPVNVIIRRTCGETPEPYLWLSDPPNWTGSSALATFKACGTPGEFYATIELAYDGVEWIGVSASGAATLLPPQ